VESLWAVEQGDGTVKLDNIPWFVRGVACGDILATLTDEDGVRWAGDVVRECLVLSDSSLRDAGNVGARFPVQGR
jgi:hypothetical protein